MIFSIRDLSFELGSMLLEGWPAFAARAVCALLILLAAWLVRRWLNKKGIPALLARSWYFTGTPILLRSFSTPILRMCSVIGVYLAAASLPWAISGIPKLLLLCFRLAMTFLVCEGLYAASDLAEQGAHRTRGQRQPAFQKQRAKLKREITDRENHFNLLNCYSASMISYRTRRSKAEKKTNTKSTF